MTLRFSILDQSPLGEIETAAEAIQYTVHLAKRAEELGYHRFWVSEHHDSTAVAGSSPEVLMAYLLAQTSTIRIGSGGVMLQHYSPYKVAENFNLLATLAPGRIDLGIGRAPGGYPKSTKALQPIGQLTVTSLDEKLGELVHHLHQSLPVDHPLHGVKATPIPETPASLFLLGTSVSSAELAARSGIPYVFAHFINGNEKVIQDALHTYRSRFQPFRNDKPQAIIAISVIVTEKDEEAKALAANHQNVKIHLESGRTINVNSLQAAEEYGRQAEEGYTLEVHDAQIIHGSKETVRERLLEFHQQYEVDEIILIARMKSYPERLRAYELIHEAFTEQPVSFISNTGK